MPFGPQLSHGGAGSSIANNDEAGLLRLAAPVGGQHQLLEVEAMGQGKDESGAFGAGPFQKELRRPIPGRDGEELRDKEEVAGRAFERPEAMVAEPESREVVARIADPFQYPLRREDLLACAGEQNLKLRHDRSIALREVLEKVDAEVFESAEALVEALVNAVEEVEGE